MIFGTEIPQIWNNVNGTLTFPNATILNNYVALDTLEQISVINGDRNFVITQNANFEIYVNLFKRNDPRTDLLSILAYENNTVLFRPHKDEEIYNTDFQVVSIRPFYLETTQYFDKVSVLLMGTQKARVLNDGNYGDDYGNDYGNTGW